MFYVYYVTYSTWLQWALLQVLASMDRVPTRRYKKQEKQLTHIDQLVESLFLGDDLEGTAPGQSEEQQDDNNIDSSHSNEAMAQQESALQGAEMHLSLGNV